MSVESNGSPETNVSESNHLASQNQNPDGFDLQNQKPETSSAETKYRGVLNLIATLALRLAQHTLSKKQ